MATEQPARLKVTAEVGPIQRALRAVDRMVVSLSTSTQRAYDRMLQWISTRTIAAFRSLPGRLSQAFRDVPKTLKTAFGGLSKAGLSSIKEVGVGALRSVGDSLLGVAVDGARATVDFERAMTRFQIAGDVSAEGMTRLRRSIQETSAATGINRSELIAGSAAYLGLTGDAAGAANTVDLFGRVALATGSQMADIATAAASLKDNLKINPADFEQAFGALIVQGKAGAIELKDLASELSGIAPLFTTFKGGTGLEGLATLGAALQAGRKGFGSASQAVTGLQALIVSLNRNASKFKGVTVFDKDRKTGIKTMRSFRQIIDDISNSKLARDPTALTDAFGSVEARRFFDQLVANRDMLDELEQKAKEGGAVQSDALAYQASAAGQLEIAMNNMKLAVSQAFTPELVKTFATAVGDVARLVGIVVQGLTAITEFAEVRDTKNRNEEQLADMGEYDGDNLGLRMRSKFARYRIEEEDRKKAAERRRREADEIRADELSRGGFGMQQQWEKTVFAQTQQYSLDDVANFVKDTLSPLRNLSPVGAASTPPIVLTIDGDAVATSVSNARQSRRETSPR